ncbi:MAG: aromatic amino acid hydroxylase, partial [Candidatus Zixiibacteriota bacterium]
MHGQSDQPQDSFSVAGISATTDPDNPCEDKKVAFREANERIKSLPDYLQQFIVDQDYDRYTPINHAVWRFVMRRNLDFLRAHAHPIYVDGLSRTGIGVDAIPGIEEMNRILGQIGWAAVCVDGFIPPAAFMAFQARRVLVIAADMRQIDHISYTPSPDIIHEAAGHAPVIADPEYADYLRKFGEVGSKAMSSKKDFALYEAIRHLSILKEAPGTEQAEINNAEHIVVELQDNLGKPSEMALLSRLHWWTVEYGLVGTLQNPKLYGAGLLSSVGEAASCLSKDVKKIHYDIGAADYAFDITKPQPQLFVTPDFSHLSRVLDEFESTTAFRNGGLDGIDKAIECEQVSSCSYSSGLQVSGIFCERIVDQNGILVYLRTTRPTALAYDGHQLPDHGIDYHRDGFGSPVGTLVDSDRPLELMNDVELKENGIELDSIVNINFSGGVSVSGHLQKIERRAGRNVIMTFTSCTVKFRDRTLFEPAWGLYDMAVGKSISSVFAGPADVDKFNGLSMVPKERVIKATYTESELALQAMYGRLRDFREGNIQGQVIPEIWKRVRSEYPDDWLLSVEMLELLVSRKLDPVLEGTIRSHLAQIAAANTDARDLITSGIKLIDN